AQVVGSPMPNNATTLSAEELDGVGRWIAGGAPELGTVPGTEHLLGCVPISTTTITVRTTTTTTVATCSETGLPAYASTWEALQNRILLPHDCANDLCHGSAKQGGLDLRPDAAYGSLVETQSTEVPELNRVEPGDERRSYLWLKLLAKTDPT